jgi:tetratricopeptide (TPR) repeat protein
MADLSEKNGHTHRAVGLRQVVVALLRESHAKDSLELAEQVGKLGASLASAGLPEHAALALSEAATVTKVHLDQASVKNETSSDLKKAYAEYLIQLAPMLEKLGQLERAVDHLKEALAIEQALFGDKDPSLVPALAALGSLYCNTDRFEEAFVLYEEAYRIQVRACGASDAQAGMILTGYATCLRKAGRLDTAEEMAERAVKLLQMNHHPALASGLGALGAVLMAEGNYARALDVYEKADAASMRAESPQSPLETAERLDSHAEALEHLNRVLEAESLRTGASSIRSTLASVPPAEELFAAKLDDFIQSPEWPHKVIE